MADDNVTITSTVGDKTFPITVPRKWALQYKNSEEGSKEYQEAERFLDKTANEVYRDKTETADQKARRLEGGGLQDSSADLLIPMGGAQAAKYGIKALVEYAPKVATSLATGGIGAMVGHDLARRLHAPPIVQDIAGFAGGLAGGLAPGKVRSTLAELPDTVVGSSTPLRLVKYLATPKTNVSKLAAEHRAANPVVNAPAEVTPASRVQVPQINAIPATVTPSGRMPGGIFHAEDLANRLAESTAGPVVVPKIENEVTWPTRGSDPAPTDWAGSLPPITPIPPQSYKTYGPGRLQDIPPTWPAQIPGQEPASLEWFGSEEKIPEQETSAVLQRNKKGPIVTPPPDKWRGPGSGEVVKPQSIKVQPPAPVTKSIKEDIVPEKPVEKPKSVKIQPPEPVAEPGKKVEKPKETKTEEPKDHAKEALESLKKTKPATPELKPEEYKNQENKPYINHENLYKLKDEVQGYIDAHPIYKGSVKITPTDVGDWLDRSIDYDVQPAKNPTGKWKNPKGTSKAERQVIVDKILSDAIPEILKDHPDWY